MSTVLLPRSAATPGPLFGDDADMATIADLASSLSSNRAWELDRAMLLERSERRAWWVGGIGVLIAVLAVLAVLVQGPLRQVIGVPIVVDKTTGETTIEQRLAVETVPNQEALDKHELAVFVRAREGYDWWWLQRDFDQVARTAVPTVFADYNRRFEGEAPLQKRLGASETWRIAIVGVRLAATGRQKNRGEATVTYDKVVRQVDRNLPDTTTRHVASLVYDYQPRVLSREKDRIENPFGFVVTAYRSDPEIAPSGLPAAAVTPAANPKP